MKLRNKKTGEIIEANDWNIISYYNSLAEFNAEWEDCEEPKEFYVVDLDGEILPSGDFENETVEKSKELGNYFETKEEAEKAVEKLKAYKRLKDKGFRFGGWKRDKRYWGDYTIEAQDYTTCDDKDLDLLFGGEE